MNLNEIIANIVIPAAIAGILTPIIMKGTIKTSWGQKIFKHKDNASERKIKNGSDLQLFTEQGTIFIQQIAVLRQMPNR